MRTTVLFEKKEVSHKFRLRINTALKQKVVKLNQRRGAPLSK